MFRFGFAFFLVLALAACSDRTFAPVLSNAASIGKTETVFVATTRGIDGRGFFDKTRNERTRYLEVDVSIPPDHKPGAISRAKRNPDPERHFAISRQSDLETEGGLQAAIRQKLQAEPVGRREVIVYVHGYNNSYSDSVFRLAQLSQDFDMPGVALAYSWPSQAHALGYSHDRDSALFARDGLETLLRRLPGTGAEKVILIAHSMGSLLVMETLRQIEIGTPGWGKRNLDGVVLISPDLDLDLFKHQASRIQSLPQPFVVFTSQNDRVLRLSTQINGQSQRLGRLKDTSELADYPLVLLDVSEFAEDGLSPGHFTVGTSPALITLLNQSRELQQIFQQDTAGRAGVLHGTVLSVQEATQMVLSPGSVLQD